MNELVPRGYFSPEEAIEYFGRRLKFAGWDTTKLSEIGREALKRELEKTEKASSKQEIQQLLRHLLFEEIVSAKHFIGGKLLSLESSIWGRGEAEYIFASGWATIRGGNEYFPAEVRGPVLIKQSSIDALFDGDSDEVETGPSEIDDERRHKLNSNDREKSRQSPRHRIHVQTVINNIVAELQKKEDGAIGLKHVVKYLLANFSSKEPKRTGVDDCDFVYWDKSGGSLRWRDRKNNNKHIEENTLSRYVTEANRSFG